jgi:DNA-binding response OmpR family regulator
VRKIQSTPLTTARVSRQGRPRPSDRRRNLGTAVDRLKESTPDLLIVRSYVEGIPGYDAATFLRRKCQGLQVLMLGGLIDDDRLQYRMTLEGFEGFPKPFQFPGGFTPAVDHHLSRRTQ